jgi:phosphosulfolactate synthase (CoM biosynthesis protein A)
MVIGTRVMLQDLWQQCKETGSLPTKIDYYKDLSMHSYVNGIIQRPRHMNVYMPTLLNEAIDRLGHSSGHVEIETDMICISREDIKKKYVNPSTDCNTI